MLAALIVSISVQIPPEGFYRNMLADGVAVELILSVEERRQPDLFSEESSSLAHSPTAAALDAIMVSDHSYMRPCRDLGRTLFELNEIRRGGNEDADVLGIEIDRLIPLANTLCVRTPRSS